ncbi:interleukin-6-like [Lates japonicus]|uniref:Interleukin-6 n=1 Tax=Lates japonicus TaxID=270547 RepID=A0AAD3RE87_LATJO|nr:interleukin-6-like protein [Lates japonicus]
MPSKLYGPLLFALMLAAQLLCASAAPVEIEPTDSPAGDTSGGGEEGFSDLLSESQSWNSMLKVLGNHEKEFVEEFKGQAEYLVLDNYKISSLPADCSDKSILSKEACLRRLVEGLQTYLVLLKHVEKEYPSSLHVSQMKISIRQLIGEIKAKMRNPGQVTVLTSNQEEQLLKDIDSPNSFHRKMTAHSILLQLRNFLRDSLPVVRKRERARVLWPAGLMQPSVPIST